MLLKQGTVSGNEHEERENGSKKRIGNERLAFRLGFVPIFHFSRFQVLVPGFSNIHCFLIWSQSLCCIYPSSLFLRRFVFSTAQRLVTKRKGLWEGVSSVFSFPPSAASKFSSRERRLGTRQLPVQDFIQTYTPTVFTMKPQINLQSIGQGINQQLLKGRVSELKVFLKQIGEKPCIEEGHSQSATYLHSLERSSLFCCWFCCCCLLLL